MSYPDYGQNYIDLDTIELLRTYLPSLYSPKNLESNTNLETRELFSTPNLFDYQ
jgi:hypothetical protein